jgi:hypothetical protein
MPLLQKYATRIRTAWFEFLTQCQELSVHLSLLMKAIV